MDLLSRDVVPAREAKQAFDQVIFSLFLNIPEHREKSAANMRRVGPDIFDEEWIGKYDYEADWFAAAADRIPFPASRESGLTCAFDGVRNRFRHPLRGTDTLRFPLEIESDELGTEIEQHAQPGGLSLPSNWDEATKCRAAYFAHWRLWKHRAERADHRFAFLPADTRIPDHTIWNHLPLVSALASCGDRASFLKLQLGPVQEFISQARSTRDLWSGSFLLSWLMASGLRRLSELAGPDAVIFPSLHGQPLFDLHWKRALWDHVRASPDAQPAWADLEHERDDRGALRTPNLPNVFLALVPENRARSLGERVEREIREEWDRIAEYVWRRCDSAVSRDGSNLTADEPGTLSREARKDRFFNQTRRFLSIAWSACPLPGTIGEAKDFVHRFNADTPPYKAWERIRAVLDMAEQAMPSAHRDARY